MHELKGRLGKSPFEKFSHKSVVQRHVSLTPLCSLLDLHCPFLVVPPWSSLVVLLCSLWPSPMVPSSWSLPGGGPFLVVVPSWWFLPHDPSKALFLMVPSLWSLPGGPFLVVPSSWFPFSQSLVVLPSSLVPPSAFSCLSWLLSFCCHYPTYVYPLLQLKCDLFDL